MWLPWTYAVMIGTGLSLAGVASRPVQHRWVRAVRPFVWEAVTVFFLYALWMWAGRFNLADDGRGIERGEQLLRWQDWMPLPTELQMQRWILPHGWLVQFANIYYAVAHVPAMIATLVWLFAWRRDKYRPVRNVLALTTAACLVGHLVTVAPPRLLPGAGFVDTALLYGQSVYGQPGAGVSDQLAAMPSVHVLWAVLVAVAAIWAGRSRWKWLVAAHAPLTLWVVGVTANHYWLDGFVAMVLIPPAWWLQGVATRRWDRRFGRARWGASPSADDAGKLDAPAHAFGETP